MKIRSLGLRTDLFLLRWSGRVEDRGEYLVASTPSNPGYWYGNLLIFPGPPGPGDRDRWLELFRREFVREPRVQHVCFQWDSPDGEIGAAGEFERSGFRLDRVNVLVAREARSPERGCPGLQVRPLRSDCDWEQAVEIQVAGRDPVHPEEGYRQFRRAQMEESRRLVSQGKGLWLGGFLRDELVGDLGLFVEGVLGRFQSVGTAPAHRRQGVCRSLIHQAAQIGLSDLGAERLVIEADPGTTAERAYLAVGFQAVEVSPSLCRAPPELERAGGNQESKEETA